MSVDASSEKPELQSPEAQGIDPSYDGDYDMDSSSLCGIYEPQQSGWLACLACIRNHFLTGYHRETFKRLGDGKFAGLHSEFEVSIGPYVTSTLALRLWIRDHDRQHFLVSIILPLDKIEGEVSVIDWDADHMDDNIVDNLINHAVRPLRELRNGTGATQDSWSEALERPNDDENFVEEDHPGTFIQRATSKIRHLTLNIQMDKIKFVHSNEFNRPGSTFPEESMELRQAILAGMNTWNGTIRFDLCFRAEDTFWEQWVPKLAYLQHWSSPYQTLREYTESPHLKCDRSCIHCFHRPDCAAPVCTVFMSDLQRTTSLIAGTIEEANFLWDRAGKLCDMNLNVVVIRDPYSLWEPQDDDLQKYGISADRVPLHQYFVLSIKECSHLLPNIGDRCNFRLLQSYEHRDIPESGWGFDDFIRIARELRVDIIEAWHDSMRLGGLQNGRLENPQREAFTASVLCLILPMTGTPDNELATEYPFTSLAVHHLRIAAKWAEQIVAAFMTHRGFNRYLFDWVQEHVKKGVTRDLRDLKTWTARRIPLPQGTRADIAIFSVRTPQEIDWPSRFCCPPVNPKLSTINAVGNLNQFLQGVSEQLAREDTEIPTVQVQLHCSPDEKLARAEIEAVKKMKGLQMFPQIRDFWEYTLDFQQVPAPLPFLTMFPQLDMDLNTNRFSQEHVRVLRNLTYDGCSFMEAGPGSGKLTMLAAICRSITEAHGKTALIAPTDDMVQDLYDYIVEATPETIRVVRMLPWKAEKHNLTTPPSEPRLIDTNTNAGTTTDLVLAENLNSLTKARHDKAQPSRIAGCASNVTLRLMAQRNPSSIKLMRGNGVEEAEITYSHMRRKRRAHLELNRTLATSDIVCATPLAFAQMMNHMGSMHFSLIVVDGAEQMAEATSLISLSKCPTARHLFIGDSQQPGPVCLARNSDEFQDIFGPQREMSLFKRAYEAGVVTASLSRGSTGDESEDYGNWDCINRNVSDDSVGITSSVCDTESTDPDDRRVLPFPENMVGEISQ